VVDGMQHRSARTPLRWTAPRQTGVRPTARAMHTATPVRRTVYVLGGWAGGNIFLNDMYALDVDSMQWAKVLAAEHRHGTSSSSSSSSSSPLCMRSIRSCPSTHTHKHTAPQPPRWAWNLTRAFWFGQTLTVGFGAREPASETDATILSRPITTLLQLLGLRHLRLQRSVGFSQLGELLV